MKTKINVALGVLVIQSFFGTVVAHAADSSANTKGDSFHSDIELKMGVEQNSNLNIVELDQSAHTSDLAVILGAQANGKWQASEKLSVSGSYSYSDKSYQHESAYDLSLHQFAADTSYAADWLTLGLGLHYVDANLDNKDFLTLQQASVYAAKLIHNRLYLRSAINSQDKYFSGRNERNGKNLAWISDGFLFFNKGKSFIALGVGVEDETTRALQFDFQGNSLRLTASHQFPLWGKSHKVNLGWRHAKRDYKAINAELDARRSDSINGVDLAWELGITQTIFATTKIAYNRYNSNFASADFAETRTSFTLSARF